MTDAALFVLQALVNWLKLASDLVPRCECLHPVVKHGRKGCGMCKCSREAIRCTYCKRPTFMHSYIAPAEYNLPRRKYPPCCSREECANKFTWIELPDPRPPASRRTTHRANDRARAAHTSYT